MEIGEHSPGQGKPAKLPVALCKRRIHTPMYLVWLEDGVNLQHVSRLLVKPATSM